MTDLEITKLCAAAMCYEATGKPASEPAVQVREGIYAFAFDPLHDDAQAMALVKKFSLLLQPFEPPIAEIGTWWVGHDAANAEGKDLNRAICECVAKMQSPKGK